jgi:hypothetical protein
MALFARAFFMLFRGGDISPPTFFLAVPAKTPSHFPDNDGLAKNRHTRVGG